MRTFFLCLLLLGIIPARGAEQENLESLLARVKQSIVVIEQSGRNGQSSGLGTGFVVSENGFIATSLHVIGESRSFRITLADGRTFEPIAIQAWNRQSDLAVIQIAATNLSKLRLGDSDNVKQGRRVYAIGNPQGLKFSAVEGIVSALRDFSSGPLIQVSMSVEPGNSGGPLLDEKGRVQGIVSMRSLLADRLAFAVPVNALKAMLEKPNPMLIENWLSLGALPSDRWEPRLGANWRRRGGVIHVSGQGDGFGGRSLCLYKQTKPQLPYEVSVQVRLEDESGAAGLVFAVDNDDRHFGFYPTAGKMRLTSFEGPTVFSWKILQEFSSDVYRPGEWNDLLVRVEQKSVQCFLNGEELFRETLQSTPSGQVGLAKFRDTTASFRRFTLRQLDDDSTSSSSAESWEALLSEARTLEKKAAQLRKAAAKAHEREIVLQLEKIMSTPEADLDLFQAAMLIAAIDQPGLEVDSYLAELHELAAQAQAQMADLSTSLKKVQVLNRILFQENGFHGSRGEYFSYENSYLNSVMDDREGIPLTLSIIYLEVGWRAGFQEIYGLSFPGHFMVGLKGDKPSYIDVFERGRLHDDTDIYRVVNERSEVPLQEKHFTPASKKEMIARMLQNLIALAADRQELERAVRYLDLFLVVAPEDGMQRFRRALFLLQLRRIEEARKDLESLHANPPRGIDPERIESLLRRTQ